MEHQRTKIGISYSWDDEGHKAWVHQLADRLTAEGFEVIYDQGQPLGSRLPHFMEQMVSRADRVLVICTKGYKERLDGRRGGVGYEGHLISAEIVRNQGAIKFIPMLRQGTWSDALPICLDGTLGVDVSSAESFDAQLPKLLSDLRGSAANAEELLEPQVRLRWAESLANRGQLVRDALAKIQEQNHFYYRVIEMSPSPPGYQKSNNDLRRALKQSVVWHGEHPWPISVGLVEFLLKASEEEEARDSYTRKESTATGINYSLRMEHMQRFEYVEARRDCSVTVVETEDFHWFRRGQLMFDKAMGSISDSLRFWSEFYRNLLGGNTVQFKVTWHGLNGLQLTAMESQFTECTPTLRISPRFCHHSEPVESEILVASPAQAIGWEVDFVQRASSYLLGQFNFDPPEDLTRAVLQRYHSTLSGPPGINQV